MSNTFLLIIFVTLALVTVSMNITQTAVSLQYDKDKIVSIQNISVPDNYFIQVKDIIELLPSKICLWDNQKLEQINNANDMKFDPEHYIKFNKQTMTPAEDCCNSMIISLDKTFCHSCFTSEKCHDNKRIQCITGFCVKLCSDDQVIKNGNCVIQSSLSTQISHEINLQEIMKKYDDLKYKWDYKVNLKALLKKRKDQKQLKHKTKKGDQSQIIEKSKDQNEQKEQKQLQIAVQQIYQQNEIDFISKISRFDKIQKLDIQKQVNWKQYYTIVIIALLVFNLIVIMMLFCYCLKKIKKTQKQLIVTTKKYDTLKGMGMGQLNASKRNSQNMSIVSIQNIDSLAQKVLKSIDQVQEKYEASFLENKQ